MPPPTGSPVAFRFGDALRIAVNGLAVRRAPYAHIDLVDALVFDPRTGDRVPAGDGVRLDAGELVWVELGPLILDGVPWYRVHTGQQPGQSPEEMVTWDADGDGEGSDSGWIAARGAGASYVELASAADPSGPVPLVVASGSGDFTSDPFTADFQVVGEYAFATQGLAPCLFRVTLEPTGVPLVDTGLEALIDEARFASSASETLPAGEYTIRVEAGVPGRPDASCPWSLTLLQAIG